MFQHISLLYIFSFMSFMGLWFDSCFEHALKFRLCFSFTDTQCRLLCQGTTWKIVDGEYAVYPQPYEACVASLPNELYFIGFCRAIIIGLICFFLCAVYNISMHQILVKHLELCVVFAAIHYIGGNSDQI